MKTLIVSMILALVSQAHAQTTWHKSTPSNTVDVKAAMKAKELYKCRLHQYKPGKTRPSVVAGSIETLHSSVGKGLETGALGLADGPLVKCSQVLFNPVKGTFTSVN